MKTLQFYVGLFLVIFSMALIGRSQTIPDDPNHLPRKIGGDTATNPRIDTITVSGKVAIDGYPSGEARPPIFVAAYNRARLIVRRQVSTGGNYSLGDVPREGSTITVEIDNTEVASRVLATSPANVIYQDFTINWLQFPGAKAKPGVVAVGPIYERSRENQEQFDRAVADLKKGSTESAIAGLNLVVTNDSKDYLAWTQLGNAYFIKKNTKNAEQAYSKAIAEQPKYALALLNAGKLYLSQNNFEKAIEILTKAVEFEPLSADAQQYLGEAYLGIKKGSKAVGYLYEALRLAPIEKAEVHLRLAALYNGAGLKPRASSEYKKFLEKVPSYDRRKDLEKYIAENPPAQ